MADEGETSRVCIGHPRSVSMGRPWRVAADQAQARATVGRRSCAPMIPSPA